MSLVLFQLVRTTRHAANIHGAIMAVSAIVAQHCEQCG